MRYMWAPWRMQYIEQSKPAGCIFCDKPGGKDEAGLILHRGKLTFSLLNGFPYNNGHLMVAPYRHVADPVELSADELADLMAETNLCVRVLRRAMHPEGFNLGMNLGKVAGAGIADHLHMHVVPRWNGDTNFMPVLCDTRVLPEALQATWGKLRGALEEELKAG